MRKPVDIQETIDRAVVAAANGMHESALVLYRRAYYAARAGSVERNLCMQGMFAARKQGAKGIIPGDRHQQVINKNERAGLSAYWLDVPAFLRRGN